MLDNFFLLGEVSKYLDKEISGYTIKEIFTQDKEKLVISLFHRQSDEKKYLEFSCDSKLPYLFLKSEYIKARKNVMNLLAGLYEQEINSVKIFNDDRIIKFELSENLSVFFVFFKTKNNLFVTANDEIIDAFKSKKEYLRKSIGDILAKKANIKKKNIETIKVYFRSEYRKYGDIIYKELLNMCKFNGDEPLTDESKKLIDDNINIINGKLNKPSYTIYKVKSDFIPSVIQLSYPEGNEKWTYGNINDLIREYIKYYYGKKSGDDIKRSVLNQKEIELRNSEKKHESLLKQLKSAENSEQNKIYGDLIISNIHLIKRGDESFIIEKSKNSERIEITLRKDLNPSENATFYFEKYKKQKNSLMTLKERTEKQKEVIEKLKSEIEETANNENIKSLKMIEKNYNRIDETSRFRKFKLSDKYEVWVGKDSASNDLLTTRYTSQNDLWFHVRGASGSHTVLKISDRKNYPDRETIEKAASIAAYYSKARNASRVPVAYCEKKHVRKKKGFKEGSVIMEREKVIFVKPGLPEDTV